MRDWTQKGIFDLNGARASSQQQLCGARASLRHILGVFLAQQGGDTSESDSGSDHCANHDHSNGLNKLGPAKGVLCQIHRCVPGILFLHGVRLFVRYV